MLKGLIGCTLALAVAGCATAPTKTAFENSRVYPESYDAVWTQVVGFFATHNIPIKNIAKDSGVIYAEQLSFDTADADCGSHPLTIPLKGTVSFNAFVQSQATSTRVTITANFQQELTDIYNHPLATVPCLSRGVIEQTILNSIH